MTSITSMRHDKYDKNDIWQVWQACGTWPAWHTWLTLPSFQTLQNLSIRKVMASLIAKYFIFYIYIIYKYISLSLSLCSSCNALYVTHCKTHHSLLIPPALTHAAPQNAQPVPSPDSCGKVHLRRWRPFASAPTELEQTKPTKRSEIHGPPFWSNGWHMVTLSWNMLKSWNHQFQHLHRILYHCVGFEGNRIGFTLWSSQGAPQHGRTGS